MLASEVLQPGPADAPVAAASPGTRITNRVTVVMVVPAGGVRDTTVGVVVAAVNGPVATYSASCSDLTALWIEAQLR